MTASPAPAVDLTRFTRRAWDPLWQQYGTLADYWRRLASEVANAIGDPKVSGLVFDRDGMVVGVKARDGQTHGSAAGWLWHCTSNAAVELDNHARWAEWNFHTYVKTTTVRPEGDMPHRVAAGIAQAKETAEAELRRRGAV